MEDSKCELIGGGSPRHLNTCLSLLYTTHVSIYATYILLLLLTTHVHHVCYKVSDHVAIGGCTQGPAPM